MPDYINVFTDGSSLNNQSKEKRRGGVGVWFGENDPRNVSKPLTTEKHGKKITNQVAELVACNIAIETIISTEKVGKKIINIYTDSMYIVNSMNTWCKNWEKNNWKKSDGKQVDNIELIKKLYYYSQNIKCKFIHVRSHQKEPSKTDPTYFTWFGNQKADELAVDGAKKS
tara:strand:- start:20 stop:529 length:510 start_codon:yes stop_codon:yes gene_type:complete